MFCAPATNGCYHPYNGMRLSASLHLDVGVLSGFWEYLKIIQSLAFVAGGIHSAEEQQGEVSKASALCASTLSSGRSRISVGSNPRDLRSALIGHASRNVPHFDL